MIFTTNLRTTQFPLSYIAFVWTGSMGGRLMTFENSPISILWKGLDQDNFTVLFQAVLLHKGSSTPTQPTGVQHDNTS